MNVCKPWECAEATNAILELLKSWVCPVLNWNSLDGVSLLWSFLFLSFYSAVCLMWAGNKEIYEPMTDANCLVLGFLWSKKFLIFSIIIWLFFGFILTAISAEFIRNPKNSMHCVGFKTGFSLWMMNPSDARKLTVLWTFSKHSPLVLLCK